MKKIVAGLVALFMCLALLGAPNAASASAVEKPLKRACVTKVGTVGGTTTVNNDAGGYRLQARKVVVTVTFAIRLWYSDCGNGNRVQSITYQVDPSPNACGRIQNFQINPNAVGEWNPGNWTATCNGSDSYSVNRTNPVSTYIFDTAPANQRCISFAWKIVLSGDFDRNGTAGYSFCMT